jgi:asparagine synthase (glutamine-hydrolysing)
VAFDEASGFDESAIANRTADFLGVKYYKKHMSESELASSFEDATWHCEHHNPDLNYVGKYALSELPFELGYKVVLTGEGADETFAGYPMYLCDYLREPDPSWPSGLSEDDRAIKCAENDAEIVRYYQSVGAKVLIPASESSGRMLNNIMTAPSMAAFSTSSLFSDWTSTYGPCDPQHTITSNVPVQTLTKMQQQWHPLNTAMYVWTKGHLANIFLSCLGDRTEMAHSIEARTPFLDHQLTEYVYGLPPSLKIKWNGEDKRFIEKWILREAAKPFITKELYERKKHVS